MPHYAVFKNGYIIQITIPKNVVLWTHTHERDGHNDNNIQLNSNIFRLIIFHNTQSTHKYPIISSISLLSPSSIPYFVSILSANFMCFVIWLFCVFFLLFVTFNFPLCVYLFIYLGCVKVRASATPVNWTLNEI